MTYDFLKGSLPGQPTCYQGSWIHALNVAGYSVCGMDNQGKRFCTAGLHYMFYLK